MNGYDKAKKRDKGCCIICGNPRIQMHHVVFRSRGGNDSELNIVLLCTKHHHSAHRNQPKYEKIFIEYLESHYGHIDKRDMKKKDKYANFSYPKFRR